MSQEEFQKLVLDKLTSIDNRLDRIEKKIDVIEEQTKGLTEFKQAVKESATDLIKKIS